MDGREHLGTVPGADLPVIKPSGAPYDELTPDNMVVCDLDGRVMEGRHRPSSDTGASAYIYRHMPDVGGVVHTHSTYATAWASPGEAIPCVLTMMADEFGGEIPIAPFALIGGEGIGAAVVNTLRGHCLKAVLLKQPRSVHHRQDGARCRQGRSDVRGRRPQRPRRPAARESCADRAGRRRRPLPSVPGGIRPGVTAWAREAMTVTDATSNTIPTATDSSDAARQVWFLTGSQDLDGAATCPGRAAVARHRRATRNETAARRGFVWKPVLTSSAAIRRMCLDANSDDRCIGVITWMHTFSPAKMWIHGLDELRKPLLHLHTQFNEALPWSTIDMDFMNLNQAAHGDREFAHVVTRLSVPRKTVAGHVNDPRVGRRVRTWVRASVGAHAMRNLRLLRFGDNMRNVAVTEGDKVEAEHRLGASVNTFGVNDLVEAVDGIGDGMVDAVVEARLDSYEVATELRPAASEPSRCVTPPGSRRACVTSSNIIDPGPSRRTSRTSVACANRRAWPCNG